MARRSLREDRSRWTFGLLAFGAVSTNRRCRHAYRGVSDGRTAFLRRPVRDTHQLKNRYIHVDYGVLEKDGAVLSASSAFPKCKSCTLNCTLGELAVLRLIADNPRITQKGLAAVIGISERTVKTRTVELQAKGLLQREGGRRNGEWVIPSAIRGEIDAAR